MSCRAHDKRLCYFRRMVPRRLVLPILFWLALLFSVAAWLYASGLHLEGLPRLLSERLTASPWNVLLFMLFFVVRPYLFVPVWVLAVAAGLSFGPLWGALITVCGDSLGANLTFILARRLGRTHFERLRGPRLTRLIEQLSRHGFMAVLVLRMVYIPFDGLSMAAGVSRMRQRDFALATLVATMPGIVGYTSLGGAVRDPRALWLAAGALAVAVAIALFTRRSALAQRIQDTTPKGAP